MSTIRNLGLLVLAGVLSGCSSAKDESNEEAVIEPEVTTDEAATIEMKPAEIPAEPQIEEIAVEIATVIVPENPNSTQVHWGEFRGPNGNGVAPDGYDAPITWSETENVAWKTEIPNLGWSSPMILGDRIWMTSATEDGKDYFVIQVDANTGEIVQHERIFHTDTPDPLGNDVNCYSSPSPVLEAGRVYVHWGIYGTACLDGKTGEVLWKRDDFECNHHRGPASSVILWENLLYLTFDGIDVQYVVALDKDTGETVWTTFRSAVWNDFGEDGMVIRNGDNRKSYSTPLIVQVGDTPLLISSASYACYAYDARSGREVWKARNNSFTAQIRPVYGDGVVYTTTGYAPTELQAIRVDGTGDVTDTHILWSRQGNSIPSTPSSIIKDGLIYLCSNKAFASCLDAETGEEIWSERIGGNYTASPILVNDRLYFFSAQGKTVVMKAGREPETLAENRLDGSFMACPAVVGNALILRTKTHLYRIEQTKS